MPQIGDSEQSPQFSKNIPAGQCAWSYAICLCQGSDADVLGRRVRTVVATSIANKDSRLKDGINHLMLSICLLLLPTCFGFTMPAQDLSFQTYETAQVLQEYRNNVLEDFYHHFCHCTPITQRIQPDETQMSS
jgi:hypothetical protein